MTIPPVKARVGPDDATPISCLRCRRPFVAVPEESAAGELSTARARCPHCGAELGDKQTSESRRRSSTYRFAEATRAMADGLRATVWTTDRARRTAEAIALEADRLAVTLDGWVDHAPLAGERIRRLEELADLEKRAKSLRAGGQ